MKSKMLTIMGDDEDGVKQKLTVSETVSVSILSDKLLLSVQRKNKGVRRMLEMTTA